MNAPITKHPIFFVKTTYHLICTKTSDQKKTGRKIGPNNRALCSFFFGGTFVFLSCVLSNRVHSLTIFIPLLHRKVVTPFRQSPWCGFTKAQSLRLFIVSYFRRRTYIPLYIHTLSYQFRNRTKAFKNTIVIVVATMVHISIVNSGVRMFVFQPAGCCGGAA